MVSKVIVILMASILFVSGTAKAILPLPPQYQRSEAPTSLTGMFALYEENREKGIGNYITSDFVLTSYNLLLRDIVTQAEQQELAPAMQKLAGGLVEELSKGNAKDPGRRLALAYSTVLLKLLDPAVRVPETVAPLVGAELKLITTASAMERSPIFGVKEDYSQYRPRGKYAGSESLSRYFRALMYTGRMGFYLKESKSTGITSRMADQQTAAAQIIIAVISGNPELQQQYDAINGALDFFVGKSDDLTPADYAIATGLPPAEARTKILSAAKKADRLPRILGGVVDVRLLERGVSLPEVTAGFRLIGQRGAVESQIFQKLTFNSVGEYQGKKAPFTMVMAGGRKVRGFPTILDLGSLLESYQSLALLENRDDHRYAGYKEAMGRSRVLLNNALAAPTDLNGMNLKLTELLARGDRAPNAAFGLWIQNRHNFILYAKQSYTVVAKGLRFLPEDPRAFAQVEDNLPLYAAMVENLYRVGEQVRSPALKQKVACFHAALNQIRAVAERQNRGIDSADDYRFLNNLDTTLAGMLSSTDTPVVVDIHTDANSGKVLEEGIGLPRAETRTYAGKTKGVIRGAVYNVFEFLWPMDKRLTDDEWRELLQKGRATGNLTDTLHGGSSLQTH